MTLALKSLAKIYLSETAGDDEKNIKKALTALRRRQTEDIKDILKKHNRTKKWYDDVTQDTIFASQDLEEVEQDWLEYHNSTEEPNYFLIYRDENYRADMISYAMNDTEITLELAKKMYPVMLAKKQEGIFNLENNLIKPFFEMERVGLKIDREYLLEAKQKTREYIIERRKDLERLAGEPVKIGQHKRIKELFFEKFGVRLASTDDRALKSVKPDGAVWFAKVIGELRTLEKWYSAYIERMLNKSEFDGRAYTQINSASAITGRVSSDFQQFPKHAIYDVQGNELVNPRRMVVTSGEGYNFIYYLDYSQIELRVQANYTYEISDGDLNMCRAYMPFKCHNNKKQLFNPETDHDLIDKETWYKDENNEKWEPVDLHAATAMEAFPEIKPWMPQFKELRFLGKSTNFAKNYGATTKALIEQFGFDEETAKKLNDGYYKAFPKILDYQKAVTQGFYRKGFVKNRYGRRYYLENTRFIYRLYNYIIQGTCADMLKEKIIKVYELLKFYKSRFQMNIHDELSFEIYEDEEFLIPIIKEIMEDVDWMIVPVVADVEKTKTSWAEKESVKL
jgi:DNA polymerase-1